MSSIICGIETSCDETAAAIYDTKEGLLSSTVFSQIDQHKYFGGVIPEIASRSQLEKINGIVQAALDQANVSLDTIDAIAVTNKPGLPGSLLVGVCFAKAVAWAKGKKLIGINHLEAHIFSVLLEYDVPFPFLCLTASGGHTSLYLINGLGDYKILGQTLDDAAGEAFDKIAKMLNLPYPGGPVIEKLARQARFKDYFHYPRGKLASLDFSFSGLKTAVLYDLVKKNAYDMKAKKFTKDTDLRLKEQVASSLLVCITDIFKQKLNQAYKENPHIKAIAMVGGVACNKYIREQVENFCQSRKIQFFVPSPKFCTDNAAMVAFVGAYKYQRGEFSDMYLDILE